MSKDDNCAIERRGFRLALAATTHEDTPPLKKNNFFPIWILGPKFADHVTRRVPRLGFKIGTLAHKMKNTKTIGIKMVEVTEKNHGVVPTP